MAAVSIISRPCDVDVSKLTYATPLNLDNGGKIIRVYNNGKPLVFQTPVMHCPYGVSSFDGDKGSKYTINLSFKDMHNTEAMEAVQKMLTDLDKRFVDDGLENSMSWFKKKYTTREVVDALYSPIIRVSKDKETGEVTDKYPPTFKVQLPIKDNKVMCEVYNAAKEKIDLDMASMKGAGVAAIVQCNGIWIAGGKFGCSFKVLQMRVSPNDSNNVNNILKSYAFLDDDDRL